MKSTYTHPIAGDVVLVRSARSRRVSIAVKATGEVRLSYPQGVTVGRALEFIEQKAEWIVAARARVSSRRHNPAMLNTDCGVDELRRLAKADLLPRLEGWSRRLELPYAKASVRATRSKWGSCSAENNISLSIFLMQLPVYLRDFVIIHELCHTVEKNHSARFHALVDRCVCGNEKLLIRELRSFRCCD